MEKVWVYLSSKVLDGDVLKTIMEQGKAFVQNWKAHEMPLNGSFEVLHKRFIVVKVDETQYNASGCSIDKLLRLIKQLEADCQLELLNRLLVAYEKDKAVEVVHASNIKNMLAEKTMGENTKVFDISVSNSVEFSFWKKALKDTWLKKYLS